MEIIRNHGKFSGVPICYNREDCIADITQGKFEKLSIFTSVKYEDYYFYKFGGKNS